ncbi:MAG: hypothetical protein DSY89_05745 [Deltaproteobacteria bacterium]|nr:MAG: hypothetical protein DSY89_05745 [Deltaproteobacteria bacterium]
MMAGHQQPALPPDSADLTRDTFYNGRLVICQHRAGYRFSIDSILLAGFVRPGKEERLMDLGCGCGVISLILACRFPTLRFYGVEIQPALASLARKNVIENKMGDRVQIIESDMNALSQQISKGPVDIVFCNPPFGRGRCGRINPDTERALARHEIKVSLEEVIAVTRRMLRTGGRFFTVFPAERITDLLYSMRARRIEPKRIRMVHAFATSRPNRILVEGVAEGRPGTVIDSPLVIYRAEGEYTREVQRLFTLQDGQTR